MNEEYHHVLLQSHGLQEEIRMVVELNPCGLPYHPYKKR
jgi:hypothetical protein